MSISGLQRRTFKRGSKTYFNSSFFFPRDIRRDVFTLYGFVRIADDFVDAVPQQPEAFYRFKEQYEAARLGQPSGTEIIDEFCELERRCAFEHSWTDAFLRSMELDLHKTTYYEIEETLEYIYGSAEVIGLYMAALLKLPREAYSAAQMLGRAMQYINFIRDIDEDNSFGRCYLPIGETTLANLEYGTVVEDAPEFMRFINAQVERYYGWQAEAERGYRFLPRRSLIPIKTASDMYNWTGKQIERNPFIVYERKVKPTRLRIIWTGVLNSLVPTARLQPGRLQKE